MTTYPVWRTLHRRTYRFTRLNAWLWARRLAAALRGAGPQSGRAW